MTSREFGRFLIALPPPLVTRRYKGLTPQYYVTKTLTTPSKLCHKAYDRGGVVDFCVRCSVAPKNARVVENLMPKKSKITKLKQI